MTTQPEDPVEVTDQTEAPVEEPVPVEPVTVEPAPVNAEKDTDTLPLTVDEITDAGREVVNTVKNSFLMPIYRLGRRYIRSAQGATESFFDGVVNEKKGD